MIIRYLFGLLLAGMLLASPAMAAKKVALVIGNAAYDQGLVPLPNSRNDAEDVAAALEALEFEIIRLVDLDPVDRCLVVDGDSIAHAVREALILLDGLYAAPHQLVTVIDEVENLHIVTARAVLEKANAVKEREAG